VSRAGSAWAEWRSQWQVNTRLRAGAWVIGAIVWVYALLVAGDGVEALRKSSQTLAAEIDRLHPLSRANPWPARIDEARQQVGVLQGMTWTEGGGEVGLVEAAFQDWVRSTAGKAGLRVRELALARAATGPGAGDAPAARPSVGQAVKLRLTVEWGRAELLTFLSEVGRSERVVVVDRLSLRPATTPPVAEIDLRVLARPAAAPVRAAAGGSAPGALR
jgi:hypothetical protein